MEMRSAAGVHMLYMTHSTRQRNLMMQAQLHLPLFYSQLPDHLTTILIFTAYLTNPKGCDTTEAIFGSYGKYDKVVHISYTSYFA